MRPKTPTAILQQRGSWLANTRPEPNHIVGLPARPRWLSKAARKHWASLSEQLLSLGVLTPSDGMALGLLCDAMALYIQLKQDVEVRGILIESRHGLVKNPCVSMMNHSHDHVIKLMQHFGLTPASRGNVQLSPKSDDIDAKFFG